MENKDLISKWLNKELNPRELAEFQKTQDFRDYNAIVEGASKFRRPSFDPHQGLEEFKKRMASETEPRVKKPDFPLFYKIAAVLVVLIGSVLYLTLSSVEKISTGYAEMASIELPDHSKVKINAGSELKYRPSKWEKERKLDLQGEAFFEVSKGKSFTVETRQGTVTVLGTKFNVNTRKDYFEVHCYEGSVRVKFNQREVILEKGESFRTIGGTVVGVSGFNRPVPGWTLKESEFDAVPLKQVLSELERQFDIEIHTEDIDLNQLFSGSFSHTDKEIALKAVVVPLQLKFKFESEGKVLLYEK